MGVMPDDTNNYIRQERNKMQGNEIEMNSQGNFASNDN